MVVHISVKLVRKLVQLGELELGHLRHRTVFAVHLVIRQDKQQDARHSEQQFEQDDGDDNIWVDLSHIRTGNR